MQLRFGIKHVSALAAVLASSAVMNAQSTTGTLSGVVKDANGAPAAGVTVIVSSPALFAPKTFVTTEHGEWRASLLPVGSYTVTVAKKGFVGGRAENIRIGLGTSVRQDLVVKPIAAQGTTVEIVASDTALVDKADTKLSTNVSAEQLSIIPSSNRSFEGAADLTPGVVTGANGQPTMGGGMTNSTLYRVDGVDIKNDLQGTRTGIGVMEDMIEDVQVVTSPLNGRNGRTTGGSINIVKKSGGNEFAGSIRSVFQRNSWQGNKAGEMQDVTDTRTDDYYERTYNVTFMGPIIKDHLWFSFGTVLQPGSSEQLRMYRFNSDRVKYNRPFESGIAAVDAVTANGPAGHKFSLLDTDKVYNQASDTKYYEGKLTWAVLSDHTLEASFSKEKDKTTNRDQYSGGYYGLTSMLGEQTTDRDVFGVGYRGVINTHLLVEARYNYNTNEITWPHVVNPTIGDPILLTIKNSTSSTVAAFTSPAAPYVSEIRGNRSGSINFKLFWEAAGSHDTDFGYDQYTGRYRTTGKQGPNNRAIYAGGVYANADNSSYLFPTAVFAGPGVNGQSASGNIGLSPVMRQFYGQDGETNTFNQGVYLTDSWTVDSHWNVMASLRADFFEVKDTDGSSLAKSHVYTPRLSVKYDPIGDARHVISFTAARYSDDFSTSFTRAFIKSATAVSTSSGWTGLGLPGGQPALGTATDPTLGIRYVDYAQLSNLANYKNASGQFAVMNMTAASAFIVDPDLAPPTSTEITLGYSRSYAGGSHVGITARHRVWKNAFAIKQDYAFDQLKGIQDPSGTGKTFYAQTNIVTNSSDLKREYNALDLDFKHVISSVWSLQGVMTYSRLTGNDEGGDTPLGTNGGTGSSYRDNASNPYYYQSRQLANLGYSTDDYSPDGLLNGQQLLKGRLSLVGSFPTGKGGTITTAWLLNYDSGSRWSASDLAPLGLTNIAKPQVNGAADPNVIGMAPAPATFTRYYSGRGAYGYNDTMKVDFKLGWNIPLGFRKLTLFGDATVKNLFNHMGQVSFYRAFQANSKGTNYLGVRTASNFGTIQPGMSNAEGYMMDTRTVSASLGLKF